MLKRDLRWFEKVLVVILGYVRHGVRNLFIPSQPLGTVWDNAGQCRGTLLVIGTFLLGWFLGIGLVTL